MSAEYRVDFTITRRLPGESDFTEYAVGSTPAETSIDQAAHMAVSAIQNGEYDLSGPR